MADFVMRLHAGMEHGTQRAAMMEHCAVLLRFIKPLSGTMHIQDKIEPKDFYQENEWRYVPPYDSYLTRDNFELKKETQNQLAAAYPSKFTLEDIKYIFVKQDSDIPELVDFIYENMTDCAPNDIKGTSKNPTFLVNGTRHIS